MTDKEREQITKEIRQQVIAEVLPIYAEAVEKLNAQLNAQMRFLKEKELICDSFLKSCFDKIAIDNAIKKAEAEINKNRLI